MKWFVGAGPSTVTQRGLAILPQDRFDLSAGDTVISGGVSGRGVISVGVARTLGGTALNARVDATYQLTTSSPADPGRFPNVSFSNRNALRDEALGLQAGVEWNAVPKSTWSPYIVTTIGTLTSRLAWNTDSTETRSNRSHISTGVALNLGVGVRAVLLGANAFVEWRRQMANSVDGSRVMPLIIGVRLR